MAFDVKQFKDVFLSEADDHLEKMNQNLLLLEKKLKSSQEVDGGLLDELMRSAHTIKSSAATMGYTKMAFFTHVLEDVFDYARNKMISLDSSAIDEIFGGIDALKKSARSIKENDTELDVEEISKKIKSITGVATEGIGKSQRSETGVPVVVQGNVKPTSGKSEARTDAGKSEDVKEDRALSDTDLILHIKVPVVRLDSLMDLTEEILIDKMRILSVIESTLQQSATIADVTRREAMLSLKPSVDHLSRLLSALQHGVMQIRLVPVGTIFSRFPRMVRDLAKSKNKDIELIIRGEELEVDRSILDKLAEPLVHLLRNAVDHGIEKTGQVLLEAKRERDFVQIIVEDNGTGILWGSVVDAAVRKQIISEDVGADLQKKIQGSATKDWQREVESLLYNGRLSTNTEVTETSGRGVGLSVVKKFVEDIGGSLFVDSPIHENGGTRFVLELPLTLAITDALLIMIQNEQFAIPLSSIDRVVKVSPENVKSMGDQDVAIVNNEDVPLVSLEKVFHLQMNDDGMIQTVASDEKETDTKNKSSDKTVILARRGRDTAGLIVDKVLHQQQIIIKPLPAVLKGVKGFSGSTILGNGEVVLIIDVVSLLRNNSDLLRV
jgi:two-component system chemotaxis sensor kinase CheA